MHLPSEETYAKDTYLDFFIVKSIFGENSPTLYANFHSTVMWLFSLSYVKVHINVYVADDGRRRWQWTRMVAAADDNGRHVIAIKPHTNFT